VFSEPLKRLTLCVYWVGVIAVSVHRFYRISKSSKVERILLRKYYHLMAVSMFVPALILQVGLLLYVNLLLINVLCFRYITFLICHIPDVLFVLFLFLFSFPQPTFLNLAFGAALAAFLVLEIIRVSPNTNTLFQFFFYCFSSFLFFGFGTVLNCHQVLPNCVQATML